MTRTRSRLAAAVLAVLVTAGTAAAAGALAVAVAPPAAAHAVLLGSTPKAGGEVTSPRASVMLRFDEAVHSSFAEVAVTAPGGTKVSTGAPTVVDGDVTERLTGLPKPGTYVVGWRVVSADGHPVSGTFRFRVAAAAVGTASPAPTGRPTDGAAGRTAETPSSFLARHAGHIVVGAAVVLAGAGVLLWERRRHARLDAAARDRGTG